MKFDFQGKERKASQIGIAVSIYMGERLRKIANENDVSVNEVVRQMIQYVFDEIDKVEDKK